MLISCWDFSSSMPPVFLLPTKETTPLMCPTYEAMGNCPDKARANCLLKECTSRPGSFHLLWLLTRISSVFLLPVEPLFPSGKPTLLSKACPTLLVIGECHEKSNLNYLLNECTYLAEIFFFSLYFHTWNVNKAILNGFCFLSVLILLWMLFLVDTYVVLTFLLTIHQN